MSEDISQAEIRPELAAIFLGITEMQAPQAGYAELLRTCPVARVAENEYSVFRMADILEINRHPDILGEGGVTGHIVGGARMTERPMIPLELDGPEHTRWRKVLDPMFSPQTVARWEDQARQLVDELIDGFADRGRVDLYEEFCIPFPDVMFLMVMGLPHDDLPALLDIKDGILMTSGGSMEDMMAQARDAAKKGYAFFDALLDEREAAGVPRDDIVGKLMDATVDGEPLTRENLLDILFLLLFAGLDTLTATLSCLLWWLAEHPEERAGLVANPQMWPAAVEELMRFQSPVTYGFRQVTKPVEINGVRYPEGAVLDVLWAAANLDPDTFDDPLTVNLERPVNRHIAFASGYHRCLGSHLARMELRIALEQFHRRIPDYRIDPNDEVRMNGLPTRKPCYLPIVWS